MNETLWDLVEDGHTRMATTRSILLVHTCEPRRFDVAVRPFVRDGLLMPNALHSESDPFLPAVDECPHGQTVKTPRT